MNKTIRIVGQGFVGTAVREEFRKTFNIKAYDKFNKEFNVTFTKDKVFEDSSVNSIHTLVEECDIVFVCVPTPMFEDGECDISIVESVITDIAKEAESQDRNIITIVKSTIPPGTTEHLNTISNKVGVVFSPEFLTEANSINDFKNQTRVILGVDYVEYVNPIMEVFEKGMPRAEIIVINSKEAEMTKYTTNLFLATKVSFFNDIYTLCEHLNIKYDAVIEATMYDSRIGRSHYMVPGPDGDRGYGGHCFPKDVQAILKVATDLGLALPTITGAHVTNRIVRKNRDWEHMEGRAVNTRPEGNLSN